jgi:hypothetical protein
VVATFEVEDGTGKTNSNAYITEAEALQYHEDYGSDTAWTAVADKQLRIREATQYLDAVYHGRWLGEAANEDQALAWPRVLAVNIDDFEIDTDIVPDEVKDACALLALKAESETDGLLPDLDADSAGLLSDSLTKVGPITVREAYIGGGGQFKKFTLVTKLLAPVLKRSGMVITRG